MPAVCKSLLSDILLVMQRMSVASTPENGPLASGRAAPPCHLPFFCIIWSDRLCAIVPAHIVPCDAKDEHNGFEEHSDAPFAGQRDPRGLLGIR
jgi:hypothetical protein